MTIRVTLNLLEENKEIAIYQINLPVLMDEVNEIINGWVPQIMDSFVIFKENNDS